MNVTDLKQNIIKLYPNLNKVELYRIKHITNQAIKSIQGLRERLKECNSDEEVKQIWHIYNKKEAEWDKFHRMQKHEMEHRKSNYQDYSHLAYNNITEDF